MAFIEGCPHVRGGLYRGVSSRQGWPFEGFHCILITTCNTSARKPSFKGRVEGVLLCVLILTRVKFCMHACRKIDWNYCILDEGHIIKNTKTKVSVLNRGIAWDSNLERNY